MFMNLFPFPDLISDLFKSNFEFYLTGSRHFLGMPPIQSNSDWDFFVTDSEELREYLTARGYKDVTTKAGYEDITCCAVYAHYGEGCPEFDDPEVHIQVIRPCCIKAKVAVQSVLSMEIFKDMMSNKQTARGLWAKLLALAVNNYCTKKKQ